MSKKARGPKTGPTPKQPPHGLSRYAYEQRLKRSRSIVDRMLRGGEMPGQLGALLGKRDSARDAEQALIKQLKAEAGAVDLRRPE